MQDRNERSSWDSFTEDEEDLSSIPLTAAPPKPVIDEMLHEQPERQAEFGSEAAVFQRQEVSNEAEVQKQGFQPFPSAQEPENKEEDVSSWERIDYNPFDPSPQPQAKTPETVPEERSESATEPLTPLFPEAQKPESYQESPSSDTKICPDCAETIKAAARVCRYCGYRFAPPPASTYATAANQQKCPYCGSMYTPARA